MKTLADIKRRAMPGARLTQTKYKVNGVERSGPLLGLTRAVKRVQTISIQFEPHKEGSDGSWLEWPKASGVRIDGPDEFTLVQEGGVFELSYRFEPA